MIDEKKLIEEIRKRRDYWESKAAEYDEAGERYEYLMDVCDGKATELTTILSIVNEQPEIGEWISIDDRLPTLGTWNIVTIKNHIMGGKKELRYPVIYMEKMYDVGYGFYENGTDILMPEYSEITAWQPLPEPWEGENE